MKRVLALILVFAMTISLTACGGSVLEGTEEASASTSAEADEGDSSALPEEEYESSDLYLAAEEAAVYQGEEEWPEMTLRFGCSAEDNSSWAQAGYYFNALMRESTGGKVQVEVYSGEQLTDGDQIAAIQGLINGTAMDISMHSSMSYANFDPRFNVVSLPYLFENYDDVDSVMSGAGGEALKEVLSEQGLVCLGIGENGFHQITNSKKPIQSLEDLKGMTIRISSNSLLMELYQEWGCNTVVSSWSETYAALKQGAAAGQENPESLIGVEAIDQVQRYISLWDAYYDCVFFCMNQKVYNHFTEEQKAVIDANAAKAVQYQKEINRTNSEELVEKWEQSSNIEVIQQEDMDTESFQKAAEGIVDWYIGQLTEKGMTEADAEAFVDNF
jgi:C4-dicarboxylate transporter DctM subunit